VIDVKNLSKNYRVHRRAPGLGAALRSVIHRRYEEVKAVEDLSFHINEGERVGFLGPNGAGKTTTLKILSGLLYPSAGQVRVGPYVPQQRDPHFLQLITLVMGQKQQLLWDLPPAETYAMNRAIYDLPRAQADDTQKTLVDLLDIGDLISKPTRQLSLGERMKCELVAALLHRPRVLFLDEPTIGLDVSAKAMIRELLWTESEREHVTLLLTSHDTGDMERVCTRAIVINHGRLLWDGPIAALRRSYLKAKRVTLWSDAEHLELSLPGVRVLSSGSYRTELEIAIETTPLGQVVDAAQRQTAIRDMAIEDTPLDDVIRALYAAADTRGVPS
jgi:ABC-2 type transport system ATP-binding protein